MVYLPVFSNTRYMQYAATLSATLSMTCCALYVAWSSPTLPKLTSSDSPIGYTLTSTEASWVASGFLAGYIPGGIISGWLLAKFGPKSTLLLSAIPTCLPWIAIIFAKSALTLCTARFVGGIGSSIAATAAPIYTAEVSDSDIRGKLGTTTTILYYLGSLFVLSVGPFVSYRTLAICCSFIPLLFVATFWFMPDSPYYLVKINRVDDAQTNITRLCAQNTNTKLVQVRLDEVTRTIECDMKNKTTLIELFKQEYTKPLIIMTGLRTAQQFTGATAIETYMQTIIETSKSSISPQHSSIIFGTIQMLSAIAVGALIDKVGRRPLFMLSALGCAVALSAEGSYFYLYTKEHSSADSLSWLPTTGLVLFLIMYPTGLGTIPNVLTGEIFPNNIKGHAVSLFTSVIGVLAVLVVLLFNSITKTIGIHSTFFIFAAMCILGAVFIYYVVPETKGKTFVEIQKCFSKTDLA